MIRFASETIMLNHELSVDMEKEFLNAVIEYFRSAGADLIIPATFSSLFRTFPEGSVVAPYGTYVIDLTQPEDILWKNIHPKHRNVIRNAEKKGVTILVENSHMSLAENLVRQSFKRSTHGFANNLRLKLRMKDGAIVSQVSGLGDHVKVFMAMHGSAVQGCAIIPFSNYCAYYMHGGSISQPLTGAMNLLQWEAIKYFRNTGVKSYNFVGARVNPLRGSKQEGLAMFKQRFGGDFRRGYMWKYYFRPSKTCLYLLASRIRSGMDVVDQEKDKPWPT